MAPVTSGAVSVGAVCTRVARSVPGAPGRPHTWIRLPSATLASPFASAQTVAASTVTLMPMTTKLPAPTSMRETAPRSSAPDTTCVAMPRVKSGSTLPATRALMPIWSSVASSTVMVAVSVV
ncbi:hypothetical protein D3C72_1477740 [compost metagenome]